MIGSRRCGGDGGARRLVTLSALLLAGACGTESLSFETLAGGPQGTEDAFGAPGRGGTAGSTSGGGGVPAPVPPLGGTAGTGAAQGGTGQMGDGDAYGGRAGAGAAGGFGGAPGAGGAPNGAGAAGSYREGGYAGSQMVLDATGQPVDATLGLYECMADGWIAPFVYDAESCTAGSLCTPRCASDLECPALADGPPSECRTTLLGQACALPCSGPADCPAGMACLEDPRFGPSCLFTATPAGAGCGGECLSGEGCSASAACCEGLVCTLARRCEALQCLEFAFACPQSDLPCCAPFTCRDGVCQSPD